LLDFPRSDTLGCVSQEQEDFGWHAQTNGMGVVIAIATPFASLRDVPPGNLEIAAET
jgi:hypothetical protein